MTELVKDLILFMIEIGKNDAFSGKEKKAWVIQQIKSNLNYNDTFEEVILDIIDYLILVDKGELIINKKVKKCFSFIKL